MSKEYNVGVGSYRVARNPARLMCIGLGSCLAIALHIPVKNMGSLAHAMLPVYNEGRDKSNPGKYVDTSIYLMVDELIEMGAKKSYIRAKLIGGAQMFSYLSPDTLDVGTRNIESAERILREEGIKVIGKDVGGKRGRTISFDLRTGLIDIRTSGKQAEVL